jgi:peptidoglycan/xylan/chitin deacetylase (PgdA/CDA1 family)
MTVPPPVPFPRPWRPTPLVLGSIALHAGALGLLVLRADLWPWAAGALASDHLTLAAAGLWPRSGALGPNWVRLPPAAADGHIALTFDDGPDPEVTPRVLEVLDRFGARATFFCIGSRARSHPDLVRDIVRGGHAVENHSQRHSHAFAAFGPRRMACEIDEAQECLTAIAGQRPRFFRAPVGLRNPFLEPILASRGLLLASWTRRGFDTRIRDPDDVTRRLTGGIRGGDILLLHDGHAARAPSGQPVTLAALPGVLEAIAAANLRTISLRAALHGCSK